MDKQEREDITGALKEELQEYFSWLVEELGYDYYISDKDQASDSMEKDAEAFVVKRWGSDRRQRWERDRYAFYQHPNHPSVYGLLDVEDLEIVHYLEELACEHAKIPDCLNGADDIRGREARRYEQDFGVLLASQKLGWMYRMDFCEICGIVEIWSMEYNPSEIASFDAAG